MRGPAVHPIVIAAGGTGGHFFPAEALASELLARGRRIVLLCDARSAGLQSPVFAGHERFVIHGAGIAGRGVWRGAAAMAGLARGVVQARGILARLDAAAIVAFGGYPSVAPVLAARLLGGRRTGGRLHGGRLEGGRRPGGRLPVILHEQNAVLGRANRFLARHATVLALSFASTERVPEDAATVLTGNPVRPAVAALADGGYVPPTEAVHLLVLGGSLGARVFSDVVPAAVALLPADFRARLSIVQQCRAEDLERVRAAYVRSGVAAELSSFFPDVAARLAAAHLVISRAGASSVAELAVAGRPAIVVPLPNAIDDHQSANARALVAARGASAIAQRDLTPTLLAGQLALLFGTPEMLAHAAHAARGVACADAASRLADLVELLMQREAASLDDAGQVGPATGTRA